MQCLIETSYTLVIHHDSLASCFLHFSGEICRNHMVTLFPQLKENVSTFLLKLQDINALPVVTVKGELTGFFVSNCK